MSILAESEVVPELATFGIRAFTTTRIIGSFGLRTDEPVRDVMARWSRLRHELRSGGPRFATASQVHAVVACPCHTFTSTGRGIVWHPGAAMKPRQAKPEAA